MPTQPRRQRGTISNVAPPNSPPVDTNVRGKASDMYRDAILRRLGQGGGNAPDGIGASALAAGGGVVPQSGGPQNPLAQLLRSRIPKRVLGGMGGGDVQ